MEIIRDPLWKNIAINSNLLEATKTDAFIRLQNIRQLGPTYLVYPGATHTRAVHSFGVYHLAMKLLDTLEKKGASWITKSGKASFAAASLFHDIGHFPFTHSLKELPLEDHESLSAKAVLSPEIAKCIENSGGCAEQVASIIFKDTDDKETFFYKKLLSGVLDPDKLDYLNRDAYYCGVPYGIQDTDYIIQSVEPDLDFGITLENSKLLSVENILFSKYLMYRSVYWHKNVRIATALMKKTLHAALNKKIIVPEELYQLDDNSVFTLLEKRGNFSEIQCAKAVKENKLYESILEVPFNKYNDLHKQLEDLNFRSEYEKIIGEKLKIPPLDILIDVPENISFESHLLNGKETVFSQSTVTSFTQSLRKIRIAVKNPDKIDKFLIDESLLMEYN